MTRPAAALVLFSGGQDSTTCLAWALDRFERVETVGFDYGQRHRVELDQRGVVRQALWDAFPIWAERMGDDHLIDLTGFGAIGQTALTEERAIAMADNGLPTTFVPGRNLMFLSAAAAVAYRSGIDRLVGGMCETDYSGYPDCRQTTIDAMARALTHGLDQTIAIDTPLMRLTKSETWALAASLGGDALIDIIREDTHTCYLGDRSTAHAWGYGCGTCPACQLRAAGWETFTAQAKARA